MTTIKSSPVPRFTLQPPPPNEHGNLYISVADGSWEDRWAFVLFSSEETANAHWEAEQEWLLPNTSVSQLSYQQLAYYLSVFMARFDPPRAIYIVVDPKDKTPGQGLLGFHIPDVIAIARRSSADSDTVNAMSFDLVTCGV